MVLTEAQRKQLFDMAMELHALQRPATDAAAGVTSLNRQVNELAESIRQEGQSARRSEDTFDALKKAVNDAAPKYVVAAGRGFGRGNAEPTVLGTIGQAKNGLMGGMWPTAQTIKSYNDAKAETPKAIADANALFAKAQPVADALAKLDITLKVPAAVPVPGGKKKGTE